MSDRSNQKARTRQAIVRAAGALLAKGEKPTLDDIAAAAGVSRATAYRYFPGLDALLSEALVDLMVPDATQLFDESESADPHARLLIVDGVFDRACREQELSLRLMLARTLERSVEQGCEGAPLRQNRRQPLIEAAVAYASDLSDARKVLLTRALSMIIGTEAFLALKDVAGLDEKDARAVRHWAIAALLRAAMAEPG